MIPSNGKSPNLEVISDSASPRHQGQHKDAHERRRLPRLNLAGEQFRMSRNGKIYAVTDLSENGMGLRILEQDDFRHFPVGARLEGTLNLHGMKYNLSATVRHLGHDFVGCEFEELAEPVRAALHHFLDPAALGQELKPIPSPETGALWYRGPSGTSLLLWRTTDGQYRRIALFVLGSYVQWDEDIGLTTGRAEAAAGSSEVRGIVRFDTLLLDPDQAPDAGKLNIAKTLLMSSNLPQDLKKWCVRQFS